MAKKKRSLWNSEKKVPADLDRIREEDGNREAGTREKKTRGEGERKETRISYRRISFQLGETRHASLNGVI